MVVYRSCTRCILDERDYPDIKFDDQGVCDICHTYDTLVEKNVFYEEKGRLVLNDMLERIKKSGRKKKYDCIVGISGGVDSTYLTWLAKEWGLRPLVLHVDNGWNSELAVKNIENVLNKLGFDLYTYVVNWEEMKDMQRAHIKASVIDVEGPFDNMFYAAVYKIARKNKIRHILFGYNIVTEGWLPPNFTHYKLDSINLRAIHKEYGCIRLKSFPLIGPLKLWYYNKILGINSFSPLNYINYNKDEVKTLLCDKLGWRDYGYKHYENIFTRFYQGYILPVKFSVDKRKSHLSTLICSGQISREEALIEIAKDPYGSERQRKEDLEYVLKKLDFSEQEFRKYLEFPPCSHLDYPSYLKIYGRLRRIRKLIIKRK